MPLPCSVFGVLYNGRLKPQWADGLPPRVEESDHHIWLGTLGWSSGLFLSKYQHVHVASERHTWSQCKWLLFFPFPSSKARVRAMSLANWAEVSGGKGLASMVSELETTAYPSFTFFHPRYSCFHQCIRFHQDCSRIFWQSLWGFCPVVQGF